MITEIATIVIDPARAAAFEAAVSEAAPIFAAAPQCHGMTLERCIEDPSHYFLRIGWDSVEAHMVAFRGSPEFQQWRALAGPYFLEPPVVVHSARVVG